MGILGGRPEEEHLHSGEVFSIWSDLHSTKANSVTMQILINHTGYNHLKASSEDLLENRATQQADQTQTIVKAAAIRLPHAPSDRPNVELPHIPAGARFNDAEIADLVRKE